jgi:hypothetical protein
MMINANFTAKVCFETVSPGDKLLVHCHSPSHMDVGMIAFYTVVAGDEDDGGDENDGDGSFAASNGINQYVAAACLLLGLLWS